MLGQVPELAAWIYLGKTARKITDLLGDRVHPLQYVIIVVEIIMCITIVVVFTFVGKRVLKRAEEQRRQQLQGDAQNNDATFTDLGIRLRGLDRGEYSFERDPV